MTTYKHAVVDGHRIFYREDGSKDHPAILLLHGFPTSSHMFRNLINELADRYHVVAPDLPGFGFSSSPESFRYTFDQLAHVISRFTEIVGLSQFAIYVFDYGAPVGFRLAMAHPERITAVITQNGNAYEEGLSEGWNPIQKYWKEPTPANREALRNFLAPESVKWQYVHGVPDETLVAPETYTLDSALMARPAGLATIRNVASPARTAKFLTSAAAASPTGTGAPSSRVVTATGAMVGAAFAGLMAMAHRKAAEAARRRAMTTGTRSSVFLPTPVAVQKVVGEPGVGAKTIAAGRPPGAATARVVPVSLRVSRRSRRYE